jgi:VanZ family protein
MSDEYEIRAEPSEPRGLSPRLFSHALTFLVFLSLWTWKLLEPSPVPEDLAEGLAKAGLSFTAAKTLHASGYAFLTVLAGTMPASRAWRRGLIGFMVFHGALSEFLQWAMPFNRTGTVRDVLIDWLGVSLGVLLLWWWNRRQK